MHEEMVDGTAATIVWMPVIVAVAVVRSLESTTEWWMWTSYHGPYYLSNGTRKAYISCDTN